MLLRSDCCVGFPSRLQEGNEAVIDLCWMRTEAWSCGEFFVLSFAVRLEKTCLFFFTGPTGADVQVAAKNTTKQDLDKKKKTSVSSLLSVAFPKNINEKVAQTYCVFHLNCVANSLHNVRFFFLLRPGFKFSKTRNQEVNFSYLWDTTALLMSSIKIK